MNKSLLLSHIKLIFFKIFTYIIKKIIHIDPREYSVVYTNIENRASRMEPICHAKTSQHVIRSELYFLKIDESYTENQGYKA